MQNFTKKIATVLAVAAFAMPIVASAEGISGLSPDLQAQVQALLTQIKALQDQIKTLVGSSTTAFHAPGQIGKLRCITLSRVLHQGDQGDDVKNLQEALSDDADNEFHGSATGFFGPLTAKAVIKFQQRFGIASTSDGTVGPLTRGFFERQCGKGLEGEKGSQGPGGGLNFSAVQGDITAAGPSSITVQTDAGAVVVNFSASTNIQVFNGTSTPPTAGSITDLLVGKKVRAEGQKNADGSIAATHIGVGIFFPPPPLLFSGEDRRDGGPKPPIGLFNFNFGGPGTGGGSIVPRPPEDGHAGNSGPGSSQ